MGSDSKTAPPLPAPTETETDTITSDLATDVSRPGDEQSSYSLPEDGTPVTIRTRTHTHHHDRSQTSLLIEYFEGSKVSARSSATERKPSVRVRLTPSKKGQGDHIQLTETRGSRRSSLTRRIPLDLAGASRDIEYPEPEDDSSMTSYASATEESNVSRNPIDIDIDHSNLSGNGNRRRRPASPLIPSTTESNVPANVSDISAIPSDSFLDGQSGDAAKRSSSPTRSEPFAAAAAPSALTGSAMSDLRNTKSRSSNRERVKIPDKVRDRSASDKKRRSKSRASSVSERPGDESKSHRRRSSRSRQESAVSAIDSTVLSSNLSPSHRSINTHSTQSAVSKSSINNPKLLETVEDAIRRLILPELATIKREQSKRESRRGSFTSSATSVSREDLAVDRRRSSSQRADNLRDSVRSKDRRNREARHDYGDSSPYSISHDSINDEYSNETGPHTPKRTGDAVKGAAAGAVAAKGILLSPDDKSQTDDRRERRRRRAESARSRSLGPSRHAEEHDDDHLTPAPPMPLMSEINPSEITRTSILSADTDRPHSASEELTPVREIIRELNSTESTPTSTRSPNHLNLLGTKHANISHGDLTALPRGKKEYVDEYETDEYGHKIPLGRDDHYEEEEPREISDPGDYPDNEYDNPYYNNQDVPPPLKYVPYQAGARGLSPIPSVSGYTEGGSEFNHPRNSRSIHSTSDAYSAGEKTPEPQRDNQSVNSLGSEPSNLRTRDFDHMSADIHSPGGSGVDYRNTMYTEDSELSAGPRQTVRGVGANPNIVPGMNVESHVASLVDGSMLEQSVLTNGSGYGYNGWRNSNLSYGDRSKAGSRGASPEKRSMDNRRELEEESQATPNGKSRKESQEFTEYELDEHGRKVSQYRHSPTASEAAITAGAVGAAAAALKAAQNKKQATVEDVGEDFEEPAGVFRNKSFKERTMEGHEPRNTPAHSVDRLDYDDAPRLSATGMPDVDDPMPEIGYVDEDGRTNSSLGPERPDGDHDDNDWSGRATPTQRDLTAYGQDDTRSKASSGLGITENADTTNGHSRELSQDNDEWHRTSEDRKRDTLVTNPYEDSSPIANPDLGENLLSRGLGAPFGAPYHTGSPGFGQKYDEGYMSNGPNRTPDAENKGKGLDLSGGMGADDPFYPPKDQMRQISGMSQGLGSPLYDASTGQGIERIENKDIIALMQHLMVRDAQRSARDTEIVALLMNAAVEMRHSFREMKDLIQDTGDDVIFAGSENTEKLQKAINGPRPYPGARSINSSQGGTIDEAAVKKKNVWKRALQGLSAKGTNDLTRIEDMMMQLLGEVDVLKTQTAPGSGGRPSSFDNLQSEAPYEQDRGYEPEGISTASHGSQSGHLSVPQSSRLANERKFSDHRIDTVMEHDDEYELDQPSPAAEAGDGNLLTPRRPEIPRGNSVPLETPPQPRPSFEQQPQSAENTPRSDKAKKHKSSSSTGWLPKISRWSNTTASSVGRALRGKKDSKYDDYPPSRSGSSLASYNDNAYVSSPYDDDRLPTGSSEPNLAQPEEAAQPEQPAPRAPQNYTPEDPKYRAHRNSLNLQHPQPRPGQTERFRTALEYSAQEYDTPMTPKSADWAGSATSLHRFPQNSNTNRYSTASSAAARDPEYWGSSPAAGPPRPPKEPLDSPSIVRTPPRNRISKLARSSPGPQQGPDEGYATATLSGTHGSRSQSTSSPKPENRNLNTALGVPTRRPTGPRAMTPKSAEEEAAREERRRRRDTFGSVTSHHTDDTDTF